jgi:hypothetical protein
MFVRELAELARGLTAATFERQMGPFALMQRPPPESRAVLSKAAGVGTTLNPVLQLKAPPASIDFADLLVALLPPPTRDGSLELFIGRSPDCELVVEDVQVSKRHAVIRWNGTDGVISELGSANGTYINGHKMKDQWTLRDSDGLSFGQSHFIYLRAATLHRRIGGR